MEACVIERSEVKFCSILAFFRECGCLSSVWAVGTWADAVRERGRLPFLVPGRLFEGAGVRE